MKRTAIPVVYRPEMSVQVAAFAPSASKPAKVVEDWLAHQLPISIIAAEPVNAAILKRTHNARYVDDVLSLRTANGWGTREAHVCDALLHNSGAIALATQIAMEEGLAVCPVSGFHHAGYDFGGGFCTFNGLMVAIDQARLIRPDERITAGILDLDYHYGNGTADIVLQHLADGIEIMHFTSGDEYYRAHQADDLLKRLPEVVCDMARQCDVILYQAGADMHVDDPLGGMLTSAQMRERDRIVFDTFALHKREGTGLVWNLAGGYQQEADGSIPKVLALHRATMEECVKVFVGSEA